MFRSKTLFVVGAGASIEAGLPDSQRLCSKIAGALQFMVTRPGQLSQSDSVILGALNIHVQEPSRTGTFDLYKQGAQSIYAAMPLVRSIDAFIENQRGDEGIELCGKLAIVQSILIAEWQSKLFVDHRNIHSTMNFNKIGNAWYPTLLNLLINGFHRDDIDQIFENVSFVIFNYDRCIEHFLFYALQSACSISREDATRVMGTLNIYHPYGVVGLLNWQNPRGNGHFGKPPEDAYHLLSLAEQINTYSEHTGDTKTTEAIDQLVRDAAVIVFLGNAFHEQNLRLLKPTRPDKEKTVFATAFGMSEDNTADITKKLKRLFGVAERRITINSTLECAKFLPEYERRLSK